MIKKFKRINLIKFLIILVLVFSSLILSLLFALSNELSFLLSNFRKCAINGDSLFFSFIPKINLFSFLPFNHGSLQFSLANLFDLVFFLNVIGITETLVYHYFIKKVFVDYCENLFLLNSLQNTDDNELEGLQIIVIGRISRIPIEKELENKHNEIAQFYDYIIRLSHGLRRFMILNKFPFFLNGIINKISLNIIINNSSSFKSKSFLKMKAKRFISFSIRYNDLIRTQFLFYCCNYSGVCGEIIDIKNLKNLLQLYIDFMTKFFNSINNISIINKPNKNIAKY
ncbi:MAG: hypothetical protein GF317_19340 [Candidatus Lokiarchaeota archaeon]|nr:hypothetical protein [Candidatus Lokiarchaeota archaeon]MBD3201653.1 hypothetical protein [Candidatus Lokiarchaeota archaeon]